jgi:hypothetical protein
MRRAFFTLLWVATGIVAIVLTLPWFVKNYLAEAGFGAVDFVIEDVSLHHLSLTDIRLGANGEQHIRRLTLAFSLLHLWQNLRADQLTIEGADLRLTVSAEGAVKISGIEPLDIEPENKTPSAPYLPVEWIEVLGSHLVVETPVGEVTVPVDMDLQGTNDEGFTLTAHLLPKHQWVEMDCRINAQISPQGQVEGRLELTNGRLSYQGVDSTGLAGWVTLAGDLTGYRLLNGELSAATLKHAVGQLTDIDLTFQSDGVRYSLLAKAAIPGTPTELRTRAEAGLNAQGISATLTLDLTKADLAQFASLWKPTTGITGQASVHMELFALLPADVASLSDPMDMLQALTTHGRLSLQLDNGAVTGLVEALTAQVDATLALAQSNLSMRTVGDWATTGRLIIAATPLDLRLSNADEAPLNLELALEPRLARDAGRGSRSDYGLARRTCPFYTRHLRFAARAARAR